MAMIPYEELVSGLTSWRTRQGLAIGSSDYLGEAPQHDLGLPTVAAAAYAAPAYGDAPVADDYVDDFSDMDIVSEEDASNPGSYPASPDATDMVPLQADDLEEPAYGGYVDRDPAAPEAYDPHRAATIDSGSYEDPAYDAADSQPYAASYAEEYEATVIGETPDAPSPIAADPLGYDDLDGLGDGFDPPMPLETLDVDGGEIEEEYVVEDGDATMIRDDDDGPPSLEPPPLADPHGDDDDPFA
ncbi:MAG TPA: hypothetical protein VML75_14120 [Kofleriaceae bacterium]|nr:hypothetical protein [Kofleriaceae bacterium]